MTTVASASVTAENTFTTAVRLEGYFNLSISGTSLTLICRQRMQTWQPSLARCLRMKRGRLTRLPRMVYDERQAGANRETNLWACRYNSVPPRNRQIRRQ